MDIKSLYELYLDKGAVSTDTRNIIPGSIFFALKGENFNGNRFAPEAIERGAVAAVIDEAPSIADKRLILVENVLDTLQKLASFHRKQSGITILAITGSNGKTTTKELCKAVLSTQYNVYATEGNLNNHIGVPLTILSHGKGNQIGVVEMGANHPGEIALLCEIAQPDYGLITNIGKAHLEGFGGIEGVARAKGELFNYLMNNNKTLFLNEGNPHLIPLVPKLYSKVIRYNGNEGLKIQKISGNPFLSIKTTPHPLELDIKTNLVGRYNAENVLAACSVGLHFDISPENIIHAVAAYKPQNNRSQLIKTTRNMVFMDAYNANPSSMMAAISEFLNVKEDNKFLILGEMREVGSSSEKEHEEIVALLKAQNVTHVIFVGSAFERWAALAGYRCVGTVDDLCTVLTDEPLSDNFILVKGSRSNRLEKILPLL